MVHHALTGNERAGFDLISRHDLLASAHKADADVIPRERDDVSDVKLSVGGFREDAVAHGGGGSKIEALAKRALDGGAGESDALASLDHGVDLALQQIGVPRRPLNLLGAPENVIELVVRQSHSVARVGRVRHWLRQNLSASPCEDQSCADNSDRSRPSKSAT